MKSVLGKFRFIFALVLGSFCCEGCQSPAAVWCTSSGIVTYNRHTGQFELLWENQAERTTIIHDTIYICPDSVFQKP